jgi:hypothetical protein
MSQKVRKTWDFASQQNHGKILYLAHEQNEWFYGVILLFRKMKAFAN